MTRQTMRDLLYSLEEDLPLPKDRYDICRKLGLNHDRAWWMTLNPASARLYFGTLAAGLEDEHLEWKADFLRKPPTERAK